MEFSSLRLLSLYAPLVGWSGLGCWLGRVCPAWVGDRLGKLLFWVGVPGSVVGFLRQSELSAAVWIAPLAAWLAILLGGGLGWLWLWQARRVSDRPPAPAPGNLPSRLASAVSNQAAIAPCPAQNRPTQGSFLLATMMGNTGYLGFPVSLALVGPKYFAWALFYDMIGTTLGAYGLGVVMAAYFGGRQRSPLDLLRALVYNPVLWSFGLGLLLRNMPLPLWLDQTLQTGAWASITAALVLIGMRLSQLRSWQSVRLASVGLSVKMLIVPLLVGLALSWVGISASERLVIVLQVSMPPAFATLVLCEAYELDRELTVTALAIGSVGLLATLPLWLILFPAT
ncbi:MAG: AEC family transporter [Cyanobacteria bacterium J069]|nr:MAG: AEC family transporter [Cyanobacteria bacterium J069]